MLIALIACMLMLPVCSVAFADEGGTNQNDQQQGDQQPTQPDSEGEGSGNPPAITLSAPTTEIDYINENISVTLPSDLDDSIEKTKISLNYSYNGSSNSENAFSSGNTASISLGSLGLPGSSEAKVEVYISYDGTESDKVEVSVPARPSRQPEGVTQQVYSTYCKCWLNPTTERSLFEMGVGLASGSSPTQTVEVGSDGSFTVTGLEEGNEYVLYFRSKATSTSFQSYWLRWKDSFYTDSRTPIRISKSGDFNPVWAPAATLKTSASRSNILQAIVAENITDPENPEDLDFHYSTTWHIVVTDAEGTAVFNSEEEGSFPVLDAGTYTVKVKFRSSIDADDYNLVNDTFTFTIAKMDLANTRINASPSSSEYTGDEIVPNLRHYATNQLLDSNDYTVESVEGCDRISAGTQKVRIVANENSNLTGSLEIKYTITVRRLTSKGITIDSIDDQTYTGSAIEPTVTVRDGDKELKKDVDYTVSYSDNINPGEAKVTITGKGNYNSKSKYSIYTYFTIKKIDITGATVSELSDYTYTGSAIEPPVTVIMGETTLVKDTDYTVTYTNNVEPGKATVTITGIGDYAGTLEKSFNIKKKIDLSTATISGLSSRYYYNGQDIEPEVTVTLDGVELVKDTDYTVTYTNNRYVGTATVTITGIGNYEGELQGTFRIDRRPSVATPTPKPTATPTVEPTATPTAEPTATPTAEPTATPTAEPTATPTAEPTATPTAEPSATPSAEPTATPTAEPTATPTARPTATPTARPDDDDDDDDDDGEDELTPAQQVERLSAGQAVDGLVTDRFGRVRTYEPFTMRTVDEQTEEVLRHTLVITVSPVLDDEGEVVLREDGQPLYQQRNLHLSRELLDELIAQGYTHIRFEVEHAALEWDIADMTGRRNVVRLAPMEPHELYLSERTALSNIAQGGGQVVSDCYRARITSVLDRVSEDVTDSIPSLIAQFDARVIRSLEQDEQAVYLLVPRDGEPASALTPAQYVQPDEQLIEQGEYEHYEAPLEDSGLFALTAQPSSAQ